MSQACCQADLIQKIVDLMRIDKFPTMSVTKGRGMLINDDVKIGLSQRREVFFVKNC